jgi:hypothetical protein
VRPKSSFEIHQAGIAQMKRDGLYFASAKSTDLAADVRARLALMEFPGATPREIMKLMQMQAEANSAIGLAIDEAGGGV